MTGLDLADARRVLRGEGLGVTVSAAHHHRPRRRRPGPGAAALGRPGRGRGRVGDHRRRRLPGALRPADDHPADDHPGGHTVKVAVLGGGRSSEHEVSLASAAAVREGLDGAGHEAVDVRIGRDGGWAAGGTPVTLTPGRRAAGLRRRLPGAARRLRGGRGGPGAAGGPGRALRGRRGHVLGGVHGQGGVQGADGRRRRAPGGLRRRARGRRPRRPRGARPARVRQAVADGLLGGHLQGHRRRPTCPRPWPRRSSTTRWWWSRPCRTAWRWSARSWATWIPRPRCRARSC